MYLDLIFIYLCSINLISISMIIDLVIPSSLAHLYGVATVSTIDKIIGSFAEYRLFYRTLLPKRPII